MLEVFTVGGGDYIVNVLNAVASWSGAGGYTALLRVVMVMAFAWALLAMAWSLDIRVLYNWFVQSTLIYLVLMVPTVTIKVTDRTNPSLAPATVANVPIGLGMMASFTSQIGDYLTRTAETVFVMPASLNYSTGGMVYGARIMNAVQGLTIDDPVLATNLDEHFKQCAFYDVLIGRKSIADITNSADMLTTMGPGAQSLSQSWTDADGTQSIKLCRDAYTALGTQWAAYYTGAEGKLAGQFFPGDANALTRFQALNTVGAAAVGGTANTQTMVRQAMFVNAFRKAAETFGGNAGLAAGAFAQVRSDDQTRATYQTVAQNALKWVPMLNIVLTVVFYAMFPVVFPLMLLPNGGTGVLKGYATGFFYLASWGPLFVVLNMMFMTRWTASLTGWAGAGLTAANFDAASAANQDIGTLAGYMIMSVPFIAAGMAKGAMGIASHSTSFLSPSQNAAEQAAQEATTGNYAYGNVSLANRTSNTVSADQINAAPSYTTGAVQLNQRMPDGVLQRTNADGTQSFDTAGAMSNLGFTLQGTKEFGSSMQKTLSQGASVVDQKRHAANDAWSTAFATSTRLTDAVQHSNSSDTAEGRAMNWSLGQMNDLTERTSATLQSRFHLSRTEADEYARQAVQTGQVSGDVKASASVGLPGSKAGMPVSAGLSAGLGASTSLRSDQSRGNRSVTSGGTDISDVQDYLRTVATSEQARETRESFARATSNSSDSRVRGLSSDMQQDLRHAQSASDEASHAEETFKRWQTEIGESQRNGYAFSRNDSQNFAIFVTEQLRDSANRHLDQSYYPGRQHLTHSQAATESLLLGRFMADRVQQVRTELGVVPDAPAGTLAGTSVMSADGIRLAAQAGMARVRSQGPAVRVRSSSRDHALEGQVGGNISEGTTEVRKIHDGLQSLDTGARLDLDHVAAVNRDRQGASLLQTMPVVGTGLPPEGGMPSRNLPIGPVERVLPSQGTGFRTYGRANAGTNQAGTGEFIAQLQALGIAWSASGHAPVAFGDISVPGGGPMAGHTGHQAGHEVDVRPFRTDGRNAQTSWRSANYDREATREFVRTVKQEHPDATVLFNDPTLIREGLVKSFDGHDNHLHLRLGGRPAKVG